MTRTEAVQKALALLVEHCDNVQVFASWQEGGQTCFSEAGLGNLFARRGQVQEWLLKGDEVVKMEQRAEDGE